MSLKTIALSMGIAADGKDDKALETEILAATKTKDAAIAASASATTEAEKAKGESLALSRRVQTLEADASARDKAELDGAVSEVKALAASASKPGAFAADREARVRALWPKDRDAAKDMLAMSREAIGAGASGTQIPGAVVVAAPADKGTVALSRQDRVDSAIAMARGAGFTTRTEGEGATLKAYGIPQGGKKADEITLVG